MSAPSCSLLHLPVDLDLEPSLDTELRSWLAFATQKLDEIAVLARGLNEGPRRGGRRARASPTDAAASRAASPRVHDPAVARRAGRVTTRLEQRRSAARTASASRSRRRSSAAAPADHDDRLVPADRGDPSLRRSTKGGLRRRRLRGRPASRTSTRRSRFQEEVGLDVLVHGESERNDMVEYFGEQLDGYRLHGERLGAELRLALREAADHLRRHQPPRAHDGRVDHVRPVADRPAR